MTAINIALEDDNWEQTYEMLQSTDIALSALIDDCAPTYHEQLREMRSEKVEAGIKT